MLLDNEHDDVNEAKVLGELDRHIARLAKCQDPFRSQLELVELELHRVGHRLRRRLITVQQASAQLDELIDPGVRLVRQ